MFSLIRGIFLYRIQTCNSVISLGVILWDFDGGGCGLRVAGKSQMVTFSTHWYLGKNGYRKRLRDNYGR